VDGASSVRYTLDEHGGEVAVSYFDADGKPTQSLSGFAVQRTTRNERGKPVEWRHFGPDDKPVARNFGHSTLRITLDARGNATRFQYFGIDDKPTLTREGCAELHRTFDERDNLTSLECFDQQGAQTTTKEGYSKKLFEYSSDRQTRAIFLDLLGHRVDIKRGYAEERPIYDESGMRTGYQTVDALNNEVSNDSSACGAGYPEAQRNAVADALSKLTVCAGDGAPRAVALKITVNRDGSVRSFVPAFSGLPETTRQCLKDELVHLTAPRLARGCAVLSVILLLKPTKGVEVVDLGKFESPG
jgi:hypothetical protein